MFTYAGTPNAFATLGLINCKNSSKKRYKTNVIKQSFSPQWNYGMHFTVNNPGLQVPNKPSNSDSSQAPTSPIETGSEPALEVEVK